MKLSFSFLFFFFFPGQAFIISCELSPLQIICLKCQKLPKCQSLFSGKNKYISYLQNLPRQRLKLLWLTVKCHNNCTDFDLNWEMPEFYNPVNTVKVMLSRSVREILLNNSNVCCGNSLEVPQQGTSNEYPQYIFS